MSARIASLLEVFAEAGYRRVETAILQPAQVFVDLSGEDIRRRLFLTSDADNRELCLRPEFTIPVARDYLASPEAGQRSDVAYCGPVFRLRAGETGEFIQAGAESFAREDVEAADADCLALALQATRALGLENPAIQIGDAGLFAALVNALSLKEPGRRRLRRAYAAGRLRETIATMAKPASAKAGMHAGMLNTLQGQDPQAARAFVEDVLKIAGIERVGGRRAGDIAERFLRQAAEKDEATLSSEAADTLTQFLAIQGDPDQASAAMRRLATERNLPLEAALDRFDARTGFLAAHGIDLLTLHFAADFARNLDYYSGFVFELRDPARSDSKPVAGGGRFDGLLAKLGARAEVRAIGFSMWIDRFAEKKP